MNRLVARFGFWSAFFRSCWQGPHCRPSSRLHGHSRTTKRPDNPPVPLVLASARVRYPDGEDLSVRPLRTKGVGARRTHFCDYVRHPEHHRLHAADDGVYPLTLARAADKAAFISFGIPSFVYGVDAPGYSLMSLATLFAAPVFVGAGLARWIRGALIANGLLTPALLVQQNVPGAFDVAAIWIVTFLLSTAWLALFFKRVGATMDGHASAQEVTLN